MSSSNSSSLKEEEAVSSSSSRRPMNAFLLFCKRHRDTVKEKYPSLENRSITKILGDWWTSLPPEDKSAYTELALEYKRHLCSSPKETAEDAESTAAPKPFKKRFLAAATSSSSSSSEKSPEELENDDAACKALLQLAGVRESPSPPPEQPPREEDEESSKQPEEEGFRTLKKAVWGRVAKTLLKQEEERLTTGEENNGDSPINLSTQCTIRGQTIIEHIIENILDKSASEETTLRSVNNNNNAAASEQIKERIYQSLKEDMGGDRPDMSALRKSLPNPLAKKQVPLQQQQQEDEESGGRPSRSCKGRRYQEFKEEGRFGRKRRHRSGGGASSNNSSASNSSSTEELHSLPKTNTSSHTPCKPFNVSAKLNALPVLSLEEYQRSKMNKSGPAAGSASSRRKSGDEDQSSSPLPRRQSRPRNNNEREAPLIA